VEDLQLVFLQIASELPTYGATVFFIRQQESGSDFVACIDAAGLHIVTLKDRKLLRCASLWRPGFRHAGRGARR
jgi:hypothetical protein